jgi:hypothetical protein
LRLYFLICPCENVIQPGFAREAETKAHHSGFEIAIEDPESGECRLGAAFLEQPECGIEYQESGDDCGLDIFAEHQFKHDRGLEHPRNRSPELFDCHAQNHQNLDRPRLKAVNFDQT